jgi:hypothetical protein
MSNLDVHEEEQNNKNNLTSNTNNLTSNTNNIRLENIMNSESLNNESQESLMVNRNKLNMKKNVKFSTSTSTSTKQNKILSQKRNKHSTYSKHNRNKSHKLASIYGSNFAAFFQKNFARNSYFVGENTLNNNIRTSHKSYYPSTRRIIVIGDVHGDLNKLIDCLLIGGVIKIDKNVYLPEENNIRTNDQLFKFIHSLQWIGGDTYVVQLGDQVDRIRPTNWDKNNVPIGIANNDEGSSLIIFNLLWYLNTLAKKYNGKVISILGNHEFMNIDGDFRYVSPQEFKEYYNAFHRFYSATLKPENEDHQLIEEIREEVKNLVNVPKGYNERRIAWHPNGIIANFLGLNYKTCVQIGKWIFVHAGLTLNLCQGYSICRINNCISRYLLNFKSSNKYNIASYKEDCNMYKKMINCSSEKSPVWNREFGESIDDERENKKLIGKLNFLFNEYNKSNNSYFIKFGLPKAEYVAIGHTPQFFEGKGINSACNGKVWRCDVGMSRAFKDINESSEWRKPQVLEILNDDTINVLS